MPFIDTIFGRKKPTSAAAADALTRLEGELDAIPARIAKAQDTLRRIADLSDEEHAAAEAELATGRRAETRLKAQIEQLRAAHEHAVKVEASEALRARVDVVQTRVDTEHMKLIERYEAKASELAEIAAALAAIDEEVRVTNYAVECARNRDPSDSHPDSVVCSTARFRTEPDVVEPDSTVIEEKWEEVDRDTGLWSAVGVYAVRDGKRVPKNAGARQRKVERVVKGETRRGRVLPSPILDLRLPPARLDAPAFWPRGQ